MTSNPRFDIEISDFQNLTFVSVDIDVCINSKVPMADKKGDSNGFKIDSHI